LPYNLDLFTNLINFTENLVLRIYFLEISEQSKTNINGYTLE